MLISRRCLVFGSEFHLSFPRAPSSWTARSHSEFGMIAGLGTTFGKQKGGTQIAWRAGAPNLAWGLLPPSSGIITELNRQPSPAGEAHGRLGSYQETR